MHERNVLFPPPRLRSAVDSSLSPFTWRPPVPPKKPSRHCCEPTGVHRADQREMIQIISEEATGQATACSIISNGCLEKHVAKQPGC